MFFVGLSDGTSQGQPNGYALTHITIDYRSRLFSIFVLFCFVLCNTVWNKTRATGREEGCRERERERDQVPVVNYKFVNLLERAS